MPIQKFTSNVTMQVAPLTASAAGTAGQPAYTLSRLLGSGSTLSLITGTNSNLTLSGLNIVPTAAIGLTTQTAEVREVLGQLAIEYPVSITGTVAPVATYLPTVSKAPTDAYGVIKLVPGYTGPVMKIAGPSSTSQDFAANSGPGGNLPDYDAIVAFSGSTLPTIISLYDQTGVQAPLTQPTGNLRPLLDIKRRTLYGAIGCPMLNTQRGGQGLFRTGVAADARRDFTRLIATCACSTYEAFFSYDNGSGVVESIRANGSGGSGYYSNANVSGSAVFWGSLANGFVNRIGKKVIGFTSSPTERRFFYNNDNVVGAAATGDVTPTAKRLGWVLGNNDSSALFWADVSYGALPTADAAAVSTALQAMINPSPTTGFDRQLVLQGDSIMEGQGFNIPTGAFFGGLNGSPEVFGVGTSGSTTSVQWEPAYTAANTQYNLAQFYKSTLPVGKNLLVIQTGTNDLKIPKTGADLYTSLTSLVAKAKATGYKVIVCTVLPRSDSQWVPASMEPERLDYNARVRANTAGADAVLDLTTVPNMQTPSNTTYFIDGLHPTDEGYAQLIPYYVNAINSAWGA